MLCWFVNFEGPDQSEPGIWERLAIPNADGHPDAIDRHLHLNFTFLLKEVMMEALSVRSSTGAAEEYKRRWNNKAVALSVKEDWTKEFIAHKP